ncbi:hypothetical protein [Sphingomonas sp. TREG-RG-20F-R18-01]|uniref:phage tail tube protein n=1 Tax=Sphingomonas sp. TREG-RG-20F-R18-01 TaxID=2914982 RepID=UPI001F55DC99|nr:hypothetical protein [Sphingomonas sp. TREG-RG-20F-R18-01]
MTTYGNQTLGRGRVNFSLFKPGTYVPAGFRYTGNTPSFNLSIASTNLDHYSSDAGIREKDKSIVVETNRSGKIDMDDIQTDNLAYFFFGSKAVVSQVAATAINETFPSVIPGLKYLLGMSDAQPGGAKAVTNVVVKVGAATKVAGIDYLVDLDRALVMPIEGGTIVAGTDMVVTYDKQAKSYDQIISGSTPISGAIFYESTNPEGAKVDFLLPYVKLTPNGDFALKADNAWQSLPFNVEVLKAPNREAIYANGQPYTVTV